MKIQPYRKRLIRVRGDRYLPQELEDLVIATAAVNNVSKRFIITTAVARLLRVNRKEYDYEEYAVKSINRKRRHSKTSRSK